MNEPNKEVAIVKDAMVNALTNEKVTTDMVLADEMLKLIEVAKALHLSGMYKTLGTPAEYYAVIQYGRELGLNPMNSLQNLNIISGKISTDSQVMLALARKDGVKYSVTVETDEQCTIEFVRGDESYTSTFTIDEAKKAGLTGKDNWKKYTKDMLFHRAVARGTRRISPNSLSGLILADEIEQNMASGMATEKPKKIEGEIDITSFDKGKPEDHQDIRQTDEKTEPETKPEEKVVPKPATKRQVKKIISLRETKSFDTAKHQDLAKGIDDWLNSDSQTYDDADFYIGQLASLKNLEGIN